MDVTEVIGVLLSAVVFLSWFVLPGGAPTKEVSEGTSTMPTEAVSPA
jgi:hypothetical protein